jgi:hypothetical protein
MAGRCKVTGESIVTGTNQNKCEHALHVLEIIEQPEHLQQPE